MIGDSLGGWDQQYQVNFFVKNLILLLLRDIFCVMNFIVQSLQVLKHCYLSYTVKGRRSQRRKNKVSHSIGMATNFNLNYETKFLHKCETK